MVGATTGAAPADRISGARARSCSSKDQQVEPASVGARHAGRRDGKTGRGHEPAGGTRHRVPAHDRADRGHGGPRRLERLDESGHGQDRTDRRDRVRGQTRTASAPRSASRTPAPGGRPLPPRSSPPAPRPAPSRARSIPGTRASRRAEDPGAHRLVGHGSTVAGDSEDLGDRPGDLVRVRPSRRRRVRWRWVARSRVAQVEPHRLAESRDLVEGVEGLVGEAPAFCSSMTPPSV